MAAKFGKWIGGVIGWAVSGPIGGLVGFSLGSLWDNASLDPSYSRSDQARHAREQQSQEGDFTLSLLVLAAAVMKADNRVLKSELSYVREFLIGNFGAEKATELLRVLRDLLDQDIPVAPVSKQIAQYMPHAQRLQLIHFLVGIARADGHADASEWNVIKTISGYLRVNPADLDSMRAMFQEDDDRYYRILEVDPKASADEIKTAYRKMVKKYHPDRLGDVGESVRKASEEKFHQVQEAYEQIKKQRKLS